MKTRNEELHLDFLVDAWNVESYARRRLLLEELESVPKTKVSVLCVKAAYGGFETHIVTVISVIASMLTIANILHKHLKAKKSSEEPVQNFPIVYVLIGNEKVTLNNMPRAEIITILEQKMVPTDTQTGRRSIKKTARARRR